MTLVAFYRVWSESQAKFHEGVRAGAACYGSTLEFLGRLDRFLLVCTEYVLVLTLCRFRLVNRCT